MLKKLSIAVLALALVACAPAATVSTEVKDKAFLAYSRSHAGMADKSDAYLLEIPHKTCEALKLGATMRDLVNTIRDTRGVTMKTKTDMAEVVGFGVSTYCPELQDDTLK